MTWSLHRVKVHETKFLVLKAPLTTEIKKLLSELLTDAKACIKKLEIYLKNSKFYEVNLHLFNLLDTDSILNLIKLWLCEILIKRAIANWK